ncbi:(2Fe-2S)-binding protein [Ornithinimicrobium murale]|uniref:(2Fe-2S)-binding protein n=1 Tax=Ornithinimicrobium murale TaxID=1050153 RepID=UPI0013B474C4|nr:(2Fe-2S)-binding protein [Ornithinimicrobium murale]
MQLETDGLLPLRTALDAEHLQERFTATRAGLAVGTGLPVAEVQPRTAVSAAQVGLVSRFWSIALAAVALRDRVPDLSADRIWVDRSHRNPSPIAVSWDGQQGAGQRGVGHAVDGTTETVAALEALVVHGAVAAVTDACGEHGRTSANVLVSNAASSLLAAARVIGRQVPGRAEHLDRVARALLTVPFLAAGGSFRSSEDDRQAGDQFRRNGCCLYYRLPGHGLCPDCVLVRPGHPADTHH